MYRTCANASDNSADEMGVEHFQCIIDSAENAGATEDVHCEPGNGARAETEENGTPASNNTGSRGDGDETCDHALHGANHGRFLEKDHVHGDPAEEGHGGADVGVKHGDTGIRGSCIWISSVEAVPT